MATKDIDFGKCRGSWKRTGLTSDHRAILSPPSAHSFSLNFQGTDVEKASPVFTSSFKNITAQLEPG